jgi:hypothetical protein
MEDILLAFGLFSLSSVVAAFVLQKVVDEKALKLIQVVKAQSLQHIPTRPSDTQNLAILMSIIGGIQNIQSPITLINYLHQLTEMENTIKSEQQNPPTQVFG